MVELTPQQAVERARAEELQLQSMQQQANSILQMVAENKMTRNLLKSLSKGEDNVLIPVGSGVFIEGKATGSRTLMEVGMGNVAERNPEEIIKTLEEREKEMESALKQLSGEAQSIDHDLGLLRGKITDFISRQQKAASKPGVPANR
jgi:prefoldin alpha subunit